MNDSAAARERLIRAAHGLNASGINTGTSGNLSVRIGESMSVTPSGHSCAAIDVRDLVTVTLAGEWAAGQRPSSEWRIHRDIYREFPEARAIVHAHPAHCVALAGHRQGIPAFHYTVALAGGADIRCAEYATFGTQALSDNVLHALQGRRACLMANHGLVCYEESPERALALAIEVEHLAQAYCQALALGDPVLLDEKEMARVLEKFRDYRAAGPGGTEGSG